eukprot:CFRG7850T1
MEITGNLFTYGDRGLVAFESPATDNDVNRLGYMVFLGGLGDGLLAVEYVPDLIDTVGPLGWSVVQPILSSSYTAYGHLSIANDVRDIDDLLTTLFDRHKCQCGSAPKFILLGHSTGCQDIISFLRSGRNTSHISKAILQAPVSDREYISTLENASRCLTIAKSMVAEGKALEFMPRDSWDIPITAERYASLAGRMTPDDMFSSDLTDEELTNIFGHVTIPTLWVFGLDDEYVPAFVDKVKMGERIEWSMPCSNSVLFFVQGGNHALEGKSSTFCAEVHRFLMSE